jgi:hypothetical protein
MELCVVSQEQCKEQIERIIHSPVLRNATALQRLLQYVTAKVFEGASQDLKEYTIGVEVFARPQDYDTKSDTIVRVQIHRLRQKLKEYYETDGCSDPVLIEIPPGRYIATFELRAPAAFDEHTTPLVVDPPPTRTDNQDSNEKIQVTEESRPNVVHRFLANNSPNRVLFVAVLAATTLFAIGVLVGSLRSSIRANSSSLSGLTGNAGDSVREFWRGFAASDPTPIIAYSDTVFLVDSTNDLFSFQEGARADRGTPVDSHLAQRFTSNPGLLEKAGPLYYESGFTGAGDLESVAMLSRLFAQIGVAPIVKRSHEVTIDDLRQHSVILVGSSFGNVAVAQLPMAKDFVFSGSDSHQTALWRGQLKNSHPLPSESAIYQIERDPISGVVKADYALMSIQPSIAPGRYIVILGGLSTTGTAGATLFLTSNRGVEELTKVLGAKGKAQEQHLPFLFQSILKVDLQRGEDVLDTHLVASRATRPH